MKTKFFIVVNVNGSVRVTKGQPPLKWDEIAIQMELELPQVLFRKPVISGKMVITDKDAPQIDLGIETINTIEQVLKEEGVNVKLEVVKEDQ